MTQTAPAQVCGGCDRLPLKASRLRGRLQNSEAEHLLSATTKIPVWQSADAFGLRKCVTQNPQLTAQTYLV